MKKIIIVLVVVLMFVATQVAAQSMQREVLLQSKLVAAQSELTNLESIQNQIGERIKVIKYEAAIAGEELKLIVQQKQKELSDKEVKKDKKRR